MLNRKQVEMVKKRYQKGMTVRLHHMAREDDMPAGLKGKVNFVDDIGQIHVDWENGRSLALIMKEDRFEIVDTETEQAEERYMRFGNSVNEIIERTDLKRLQESCNGSDPQYAAETLLDLHRKFDEVYGTGFVDESNGIVRMPGIVRGRETGKQALALLLVDLKSSGEHWGTTFLTERGPILQGNASLTEELKKLLREEYIPYDYWYTPNVKNDIHISVEDMPESVAMILSLVYKQDKMTEDMGMEGLKI